MATIPELAASDALTVSASSAAAADYVRTKSSDGSFKPEYYVIANGGKFPGTTRDDSFEKISYPQVAGIVAQQLASQQYYLAPKSDDASLLILVFWGQTIPFNDVRYRMAVDQAASTIAYRMGAANPGAGYNSRLQARLGGAGGGGGNGDAGSSAGGAGTLEFALALIEMENRERDVANLFNAKVLGFVDAINEARTLPPWADVGGNARELESCVEDGSYYVIVAAYDFVAMREKQRKSLRWVTRISIGSRGNAFNERVAQMVASAATHFGQGGGLRRHHYGDAKVILGDIRYLGEVPAPPQSDRSSKAEEAK